MIPREIKKKYDEKRSKSRSKRRSMYMPRSGSSSTIDGELLEDSVKDKKEKARELLKKKYHKIIRG